MAYSPSTEQWRSLASQYFAPEDVDKALWVIEHESGGNANAVGDGGASIGLFQLNANGVGYGMGDARYDPAANMAAAAAAVYGGSGWAPWGENNLYNGSVFGSLGNNPYPGNTSNARASTGATVMADPIYVGPASGGGGMYYDPSTGMTWTQATGWYYSSGGDPSGGVNSNYTPSGGSGSGLPSITDLLGGGGSSTVAPRWTGNGPNGYGTYLLDGPGGAAGTFIGNPTNPSSGGGSSANYTIEVDPQTGRRYRANNGVFVSWMDPAPSAAATTSTVGAQDRNGDGIDDSTGFAVGVYRDSTSPSGYYYPTPDGRLIAVTPNGAPYNGPDLTPESTPRATTWTGYGPRGQGTYYLDGPGGTPGTYIGPTTAAGAGASSSGSSGSSSSVGGSVGGGGGSQSSSTRSGGFNNTSTNIDIRQGGFTNTTNSTSYNTSDIGPNTIADRAADRAQQAAQFAATNSLQQQQERRQRAMAYAQALETYDPAAFAAFIRQGGGDLQNAIGTGGNAISEQALTPAAMLLQDGNGGLTSPAGGTGATGGTGGGGTGGAAGGAGGAPSPAAGGTAGTPGAPGTAPANTSYDYWLNNVYQPVLDTVVDGVKTRADQGDLQAKYQAWLAQQPQQATPAPVDPWVARYGAPPTGYDSWQQWAMATVPAIRQNNGASEGGQSFDINSSAVIDQAAAWVGALRQQEYWQANPAAAAQAQRTIDALASPWGPGGFSAAVGRMGSQVRAGFYGADTPGSAQWNNNLTAAEKATMTSSAPTGGLTTGGGTTVSTGGDTAANPGFKTITTQPNTVPVYDNQFSQPYPNLGTNTNGTPVSPVQLTTAPHFDYATNQWVPTPKMAHGGLTRAPQMIVGDPQRDGRPNPEMIVNPTGAPISVVPMRNMQPRLPQPDAMAMAHANDRARFMRVGGLSRPIPRFAYGTQDFYERSLYDAPSEPVSAPTSTQTQGITPDGSVTAMDLLRAKLPAESTTQPQPAATTTTTSSEPTVTTTYGGITTGGETSKVAPASVDAPTATTVPTFDYRAYLASLGNTTAPAATTTPAPTATTTPAPAATPANNGPYVSTGNPYFDQALADRLASQLPAWAQGNNNAFMLADYDQRDPIERQLYEQYLQVGRGIPIESTRFAAAKNRMGGLSRGGMQQGY